MEAFKGVQYAFLIGGFPRLKGMLRKDLIAKNTAIFSETGKAIDAVADKNIKVLVVANPANTNACVLMEHAPSIPRENFSAMTRLDANRAKSLMREVAVKKLNRDIPLEAVKNIIIWGNHSDTQFPDVNFATIEGKPARAVIGDDAYLDGEFMTTVQLRGKAVIAARGMSSACSAAKAACDHMHDWVCGTKEGEYSIMSVCSDGKHYDVPEGLIFSFPVTVKDGKWSIVEGLELDQRSKEFFAKTIGRLYDSGMRCRGAEGGKAGC